MFQLFGFAIFVGVVLPIILGVLIFIWCALKLINWVRSPEKKLLEENARLREENGRLNAENDKLQENAKQRCNTEWVEYD